jgi:hypothetical protein
VGHGAITQPVTVAVPGLLAVPAGTVAVSGPEIGVCEVQSTNPGIVTDASSSTALELFNVTVTVTGVVAESDGITRLALPLPLSAKVEFNARSQVRLIGTTVTEALAEQVEPRPVLQALRWLVAPTALVMVTVLLTVPAEVGVNDAKPVADPPAGIVLGIAGLKVNPVLSLMATLLRSS